LYFFCLSTGECLVVLGRQVDVAKQVAEREIVEQVKQLALMLPCFVFVLGISSAPLKQSSLSSDLVRRSY
jgi:hypothetical protein